MIKESPVATKLISFMTYHIKLLCLKNKNPRTLPYIQKRLNFSIKYITCAHINGSIESENAIVIIPEKWRTPMIFIGLVVGSIETVSRIISGIKRLDDLKDNF